MPNNMHHRSLHAHWHERREALQQHHQPEPRDIPDPSRTIFERTPAEDSPKSTCSPGDNSPQCQKPALSGTVATLPIVLGAVIPICAAIVVFYFLHRRHLKKQRIEDANDPHKSLDFGLHEGGVGKQGIPEMRITELEAHDPTRPGKRPRGFSMDMGSPYLLPAGLQGSHESIRSMSRGGIHDDHDPYRPVNFARPSAESAMRPRFGDNGSVYSASTDKVSERANLVVNASRMSQSYPARIDSEAGPIDSKLSSLSDSKSSSPLPMVSTNAPQLDLNLPPTRGASLASPMQSHFNLAQARDLPPPPEPPVDVKSLPPPPPEPVSEQPVGRARVTSFSQPRPPKKEAEIPSISLHPDPHNNDDYRRESSNYGDDDVQPHPQIPVLNEPHPEPEDYYYEEDYPQAQERGRFSIDDPGYLGHDIVQDYAANQRLSVVGLRPLPPQSMLQDDNPEQRANRIRSFYKEYFDDGKNARFTYFDDGADGQGGFDGAIYDPDSGTFMMPQRPFAQAPGRRAMTPPPRGAPRFSGEEVHRRQYSTMSANRGPFRGRPPPTKKLPPPKPLTGLPTPSKLGYDDALFNPIDFAPPTSFREMQNGRRPDSPMGMSRPYSPSVRAFTPLASSFSDLPAMPSPHLLRKSGTFTALDFAPPKLSIREGNASDAGSIRSARSGISAMQMDAVRAGAYRVSRIPKEMVTTRDDMNNQLRPKLNMITPA